MKSVFYPLNHHKNLILWLMLFGLVLRLFQLGEWSLWHDEALTVLLADQAIADLITITTTDVHPPLYFLLVKLFMLLGRDEFVVRLPSALFGVGSILTLYLVGKNLFDGWVGLWGGFILAVSPLQLFYAQEARMYTLLILLTTLSAWCFIRALKDNSKLWWNLFIFSTVLAIYTAYFAFFVLAAMGLYVLLIDARRERILRFLLAMGVIALLYLPWIGISFSQIQAVLDSYWITPSHPLKLFTTLTTFFFGVTLSPFWIVVSLAVTLLFIFIVFDSVFHALRKNIDVRPLIWLLLWGFVPLLGIFLISLARPIFQLRTVIIAAPAFYLLGAWGIARAQHKRLNFFLFLPVLAMMFLSTFNFYFDSTFVKPGWREAAYYVQERVRIGDVVLHTSASSFLTFLAYEHTVQHILLPLDSGTTRQNAPSQSIISAVGGKSQPIARAVQGYERAWLVVGFDDMDAVRHQKEQKKQLDARYRLLQMRKVAGIFIFTYALDLYPSTKCCSKVKSG